MTRLPGFQYMNCPDEIATVLLRIIRIGMSRIRAAAANREPEQCAIEEIHLHNLRSILQDFSEELLMHYYRIEIRRFVTDNDAKYPLASFENEWSKLARYIELR